MSKNREDRRATQADLAAAVFDANRGGVSKAILGLEVFNDPDHNPQGLLNYMRLHAESFGHVPVVLRVGGEYIYGWAETIAQHLDETYKRAKREAGRLTVDSSMLEEQVKERPDLLALRRRLVGVHGRLEALEVEMDEMSALRVEVEAMIE